MKIVTDGNDSTRVTLGELRKLLDEGLVIHCSDQVDVDDYCLDYHPTLRSDMDAVLARLREIRA